MEGCPARLALASACIRFWIKSMGGVTAVELAAITASLLQVLTLLALLVHKYKYRRNGG
jgi:Flp pilus assembly protein TadG